ncbi:nuclear transport factor 2 family protein [Cellulomonas sp. KRMCY2]|uniref:nuclear transport factor 2 family protein n=1 Tax=Cellulomonas sp. KRMCY2 TaxID=1304865 RepID=UPI00045EABC7|nr:nuclear transport factor 2 family protein [Cellulomonas sp. KRMCY2]
MTVLEEYIDGWRRDDVDAVLATLAHDCVVTESYGPVYRGPVAVRRWMEQWFGQGGQIHRWETTSHRLGDGFEVAEWTFECTWAGNRSTFDGITLATTTGGRVHRLREYQTTAPLYEWDGTWR